MPAASGASAEYKLQFSGYQFTDPVVRHGSDPPAQTHTKRFLEQIVYPELDAEETYRFEYAAGNLPGYMSARTLPTGAKVDYTYFHYTTGDGRPYKIELAYKQAVLDEDDADEKPLRWSYQRFGDGVIRSLQEALVI
jgi:hypothetical protein